MATIFTILSVLVQLINSSYANRTLTRNCWSSPTSPPSLPTCGRVPTTDPTTVLTQIPSFISTTISTFIPSEQPSLYYTSYPNQQNIDHTSFPSYITNKDPSMVPSMIYDNPSCSPSVITDIPSMAPSMTYDNPSCSPSVITDIPSMVPSMTYDNPSCSPSVITDIPSMISSALDAPGPIPSAPPSNYVILSPTQYLGPTCIFLTEWPTAFPVTSPAHSYDDKRLIFEMVVSNISGTAYARVNSIFNSLFCENCLSVAIGQTVLGGFSTDISSLLLLPFNSSLSHVKSEIKTLIVQVNLTSLSLSSGRYYSSSDVEMILSDSIVSGLMANSIHKSSRSCSINPSSNSTCCSRFSNIVVCLYDDPTSCVIKLNPNAPESSMQTQYICSNKYTSETWGRLYMWSDEFNGYIIWLSILFVVWICLTAVISVNIHFVCSTYHIKARKCFSKVFSQVLALMISIGRMIYFLLLCAETASNDFNNFACVEFSVVSSPSTNGGVNGVEEFWNPYLMLSYYLFYPMLLGVGEIMNFRLINFNYY